MIQNIFKTEIFNNRVVQEVPEEYTQECRKIALQYNSRIVSNRGGYQSPVLRPQGALIHFFEQNLPYALNMMKEAYDVKKPLRNHGFWVNINKSSNYNVPHLHPGCVFSGVFYLKAPKDAGSIIFHADFGDKVEYSNQVKKLTDIFHIDWKVPITDGLLLIFPSWLKHSVELSETESERISIAFNYGW